MSFFSLSTQQSAESRSQSSQVDYLVNYYFLLFQRFCVGREPFRALQTEAGAGSVCGARARSRERASTPPRGARARRGGHCCQWGGRRDLNPRQPDPQSGALTRLSYDHHSSVGKLGFARAKVKLACSCRPTGPVGSASRCSDLVGRKPCQLQRGSFAERWESRRPTKLGAQSAI